MIEAYVKPAFYADATAILFLTGIVVLSNTGIRKKDLEDRLFAGMALICIAASIIDVITYIFYNFEMDKLMALGEILGEICVLFFIILWVYFVDYKLYHSRDHLRLAYRYAMIPGYVAAAVFFINMIYRSFLVEESRRFPYLEGLLYDLFYVTCCIYMGYSFFLLYRYRKENGSLHFFHVWELVVPIAVGSLVNRLTVYSTRNLGFAVGLTLLYFYILNERCYKEGDSAVSNRAFLDRLEKKEAQGEYSFESGLAFFLEDWGEEKRKAFSDILEKETPPDSEVLYLGDGIFVILTGAAEKSALSLLSEDVAEGLEDWNRENDGCRIGVTQSFRLKREGEDLKTFLDGLKAEYHKDAGQVEG